MSDDPEFDAAYEKIKKALVATREDARQHGLGPGHGGNRSIPCPCCEGGTLKYSVAGVNGHLWGACSTKDCVRWMQ